MAKKKDLVCPIRDEEQWDQIIEDSNKYCISKYILFLLLVLVLLTLIIKITRAITVIMIIRIRIPVSHI